MIARLHHLGLIFSLALVSPAYGQVCSSFFENATPVNITTLERFYCNVAGSRSLVGPLQSASKPSLLRVEFDIWENETWQSSTAEQHGYDGNGFHTGTVFQSWDGDSWLNSSQAVFVNDPRGRRLTFISQLWDGESWQNNARRINTWNELDERIETVHEDWIEGAWVAHRRDLMSYANGLLIEEVLETYRDMRWNSSFRYSQEYDGEGRQVRSLSEYYDSSALKWVANGQGMVVYGDNYSEVSFQSWDSEAGDWFTYSRSVIELNGQGDPVLSTHERRSPNEDWTFTRLEMHTYNDAGLATELLIQKFEGTDWQNDGLYTSTYDDAGNLINRMWSKWDSSQHTWSPRSMRTYVYGEATRLEDSDAYSLVSIDVYPLPARDHVQFNITLGKPSQLIVDVYDLLGRQVVRLRDDPLATGMQQIDWRPEDLSPGVYLARIHTGQRIETRKLVLVE